MTRTLRQPDSLGFAIALCALLFALTVRALVPAGYMLETQTDGVELVLCDSAGLRTVVIDADGEPIDKPKHPDDRKREAVCAFTGVAAVAPDLAAPAPSAAPLWTVRPVLIQTPELRDRRNPRGPPPLRGPPLLMI